MTKLYYADPLSAAYMAREFGVKMYIEGSNVELNSWNDFFVEYGGGTIDAFSDWKPVHTDFTIKFPDDDVVVTALPADPNVPLTNLTFLAGQSRTLLLRFPRLDLTIYGVVLILNGEDAQFLFP